MTHIQYIAQFLADATLVAGVALLFLLAIELVLEQWYKATTNFSILYDYQRNKKKYKQWLKEKDTQ